MSNNKDHLKRVLFLANHYITLYNFRRELIEQLIKDGNEIFISIPPSKDNHFFLDLGCKIIEIDIDRRGTNPFKDLKLVLEYMKVFRRIKPDIVFSYTAKPNIYGSIASNLLKIKQVNNITGLGGTFYDENIVSKIVRLLYRFSVKYSYLVFFQNTGDLQYFKSHKLIKDNYKLLPGSGVNLEQYKFTNLPSSESINFIFIGRIMEIKGVDQYLEVAKRVRDKDKRARFFMAGFIEQEKYKKIIEEYNRLGIIEYVGFQKDISEWIKKMHCTVLPSICGEGTPNVLLESAAMGRICIASDIAGSRDVVSEGETGYVFEPGNSNSLFECVDKILNHSEDKLAQMGKSGRQLVENNYDRKLVIKAYKDELK